MEALVEKCLEPAHSREPELDSSKSPQGEIAAPITVYSRRETDENYKGVTAREGELRIVNCSDDLQWIVQRFKGGQWRNNSFHRSRQSLIRRYGPLGMTLPCQSIMTTWRMRAGAVCADGLEASHEVGLYVTFFA